MKKIKLTLLSLLLVSGAMAQSNNVGIGTITPDPSAQLDVTSTNKGLLPPRMTKVQMNAIAAPAAGLIVYCTDCTPPALYTFDGSTWNVLGSATNPNATFASNTLSCSGTPAGNYVQYTAMNSSNTKTVTIQCNTAGSVTGSTNTVNGVTFSANTTLYSTGPSTPVTLIATGTPQASGTFAYTATVAGQTCNFNVTYAAGATFNCGAITITLPTNLVNGTAYNTGSVSLPYTAGTGAAYPTATVTSNGLTLTRVAGTYAPGGGNVVYNLSGTYTGATGGNAVFTLLDGGCNVAAGAATITGSPACGTPVGSYVSGAATTSGNTVPITVNATSPGYISISTNTANGVTFSGVANIISTGVQVITLTATGTPLTSGAFSYTVTIGGQTCGFTVTYDPKSTYAVAKIGSSYAVSSNTDVTWSSQVATNGVTISGANITLLAGKTYKLTAAIKLGSGGAFSYEFVNSGNTRLSGTSAGWAGSPNQWGARSNFLPAQGVYTVGGTNEVIKVRVKNAYLTTSISSSTGYGESFVTVEELPGNIQYTVGNITSSISGITASSNVSWTNQLASNGVTISGSSITLRAGKTYRLSTTLLAETGQFTYEFVNGSNAKLTGTSNGFAIASSFNAGISTTTPAQGIYQVGAADEVVKVQIVNAIGSPNLYATTTDVQPSIIIEEIPATSSYAVGNMTSSTGVLSGGTDISWSNQLAGNGVTISGANITLLAGKTYKLSADVLANNSGYLVYTFVNSSNTKLTGSTEGLGANLNVASGETSIVPATGIYKVGATNEVIKARITYTYGSPTITASSTVYEQPSIVIKEIE